MIPIADTEFKEITDYININYGVNLVKKRHLVEGRLGIYLESSGFDNYHDYFQCVKKDSTNEELANLLNMLTTNHTFFFREPQHFDFYKNTVMPWIDKTLGDTDLRVWCAGCSSGQEPYTLSIVTLNYLRERRIGWDTVILATDISDKALAYGSAGIYRKEELSALPDDWCKEWFTEADSEHMTVTNELRKNVAFKRMNLMDAFYFTKPFHLIMCRNVMIYFDSDSKKRVIEKIYDALMPGGYLFISHSESLSSIANGFEYVVPSVYRKPLR